MHGGPEYEWIRLQPILKGDANLSRKLLRLRHFSKRAKTFSDARKVDDGMSIFMDELTKKYPDQPRLQLTGIQERAYDEEQRRTIKAKYLLFHPGFSHLERSMDGDANVVDLPVINHGIDDEKRNQVSFDREDAKQFDKSSQRSQARQPTNYVASAQMQGTKRNLDLHVQWSDERMRGSGYNNYILDVVLARAILVDSKLRETVHVLPSMVLDKSLQIGFDLQPFVWLGRVFERATVARFQRMVLNAFQTHPKAKLILMPLTVPGPTDAASHANCVVIDKDRMTVEVFEPHGMALRTAELSSYTFILECMQHLLPFYRVSSPTAACPSGLGPQTWETGPYCLTWCFMFLMVRIWNPELSGSDVALWMTRTPGLLRKRLVDFTSYAKRLAVMSHESLLAQVPQNVSTPGILAGFMRYAKGLTAQSPAQAPQNIDALYKIAQIDAFYGSSNVPSDHPRKHIIDAMYGPVQNRRERILAARSRGERMDDWLDVWNKRDKRKADEIRQVLREPTARPKLPPVASI
jgi:hypothetical protein